MTVSAHHEGPLPALPSAIKDADSTKEILHQLRHFHLGNPDAQEQLEPVPEECLPALLDPYRDNRRLRYEYPLVLLPVDAADPITPEQLTCPLSSYLQQVVGKFAPDADSARILKDNLPWLERDLRQHLDGTAGNDIGVPAHALLESATQRLLQHLALDSSNQAKLESELQQLLQQVPEQAQLLGYGIYPSILLMVHVVRSVAPPRHTRFRQQINERIQGLRRLLEVEKEKSLEAIEPASIRSSVGPAADLLNPEALSEVMDHSHGSVAMATSRRIRIEQALATLEAYHHDPILVRFVYAGTLQQAGWTEGGIDYQAVIHEDPCAYATRLFDEHAVRLAKVFAANRIAQLEIDDLYEQGIHDPWFASFGWEAFSKEELLLIPAVIALEGADRLAGEGMPSFSRLLNSGRPVQILVRVQAHHNPGAQGDEDPFQSYRTELGYLGISHRKAFVAQTSAARHSHLLQGFLQALDATRTSLHLINTGLKTAGTETSLNAWLVAGAALEGRAHPFFRINPDRGDAAADRMDFCDNPQPERNWPVSPFRYQNEEGAIVESEVAFTFADYALLMPKLTRHFAQVPAVCETASLVAVADYLKLPPDEASHQLPFIWGVDRYGALLRLVITRTLVHACRDRLNYWHALQEMAGVRNSYVERAVALTREQLQAEFDHEKQLLAEQHAEQLAGTRNEVAGEVMGRLTEVLMGLDLSAAQTIRPAASTPPAAASEAPAADTEQPAEPAAAEPEEEALSFDEPWIDSPLCTSCNDCTKINPLLFVYNDNNQAVIADVNAGTFSQLVEAAELCPSSCIHPGKPVNPAESGLDELIERAAAYN